MTADKCVWKLVRATYFWRTKCKNKVWTDTMDKKDAFNFCPYCGKEIEVKNEQKTYV